MKTSRPEILNSQILNTCRVLYVDRTILVSHGRVRRSTAGPVRSDLEA